MMLVLLQGSVPLHWPLVNAPNRMVEQLGRQELEFEAQGRWLGLQDAPAWLQVTAGGSKCLCDKHRVSIEVHCAATPNLLQSLSI